MCDQRGLAVLFGTVHVGGKTQGAVDRERERSGCFRVVRRGKEQSAEKQRVVAQFSHARDGCLASSNFLVEMRLSVQDMCAENAWPLSTLAYRVLSRS